MSYGHISVAPGTATLRVGNTVLDVRDCRDTEHWSTVDYTPSSSMVMPYEAFCYGKGQQVTGSVRWATGADTSIPRSGSSGLPQGYRFIVFGWRATIVGPREVVVCEALQAWFATTVCEYMHNGRIRAEWPLSELLRTQPGDTDPQDLLPAGLPSDVDPAAANRGARFTLPIDMREHLSFGVAVKPQCNLAAAAAALTLRHTGSTLHLRVFLRGIEQRPVY